MTPPDLAEPSELPSGISVLCLDDESMIGDLVSQIIRNHLQVNVVLARTGQEALAILERQNFDIVIVDFVMPHMDGGQFYRELERRSPDVAERVLFITGDVLSESTLDTIRSTGRRLLEKPFGLPDLTRTIREMLACPRT